MPYPQWHDAFRQSVDRLRASFASQPSDQINNMSSLGELLAEHAIATTRRVSKDSKQQQQADQLLNNRPGKPDIGQLTISQNVQQAFPWLRHYASLRELRSAHPAPRGQTQPLQLEDQHAAVARGLLRLTVEGWVSAMYAAAGQPPPPRLT